MTVVGMTFDNQDVSPKNDGIVYKRIFADGIVDGCALTTDGDELTIATGYMVMSGRYFQISVAEVIDVDGATSGYARVKAVIDTTATASAEAFEQVTFEVEYNVAADGFDALTQEDINASGETYEFQVCICSLDAGGIDTITTQPNKTLGGLYAGTTDMTAGTTALTYGTVYYYYESV